MSKREISLAILGVAHMFRCSWKCSKNDSLKRQRQTHNHDTATRKASMQKKQLLTGVGGKQVDPPIHTEYVHSCGATTRTSSWINNAVSCFFMFWKIHWNMVVPPENTILTYKSLRMSTSHFIWRELSRIPLTPLLVKLDWNNSSAWWKRSAKTVMMCTSSSSKVFSLSVSAIDLISVSWTPATKHHHIPSKLLCDVHFRYFNHQPVKVYFFQSSLRTSRCVDFLIYSCHCVTNWKSERNKESWKGWC